MEAVKKRVICADGIFRRKKPIQAALLREQLPRDKTEDQFGKQLSIRKPYCFEATRMRTR